MGFCVCTECSLIQLGLLAHNWLSFAVFFKRILESGLSGYCVLQLTTQLDAITCRVFLLMILQCSQSGDHPEII
jgi:hypothetical protein